MPLFYSISPSPLQIEDPLSLYVDTAWYVNKCPYCNFNSHEKNVSNMELTFEFTEA